MLLPENMSDVQDQLFDDMIKRKFGDNVPSQEFRNLLYEFYLTGARDSIELIAKRIVYNER